MFDAIRENEQEKALVYFNESLKKAKTEKDIEGLAEFARSLHMAGFLEQSKESYLLLQELAPEIEEWNLFLAEIAIDQNQTDSGLDLLLQFDKESELYPNALLMLADAYQTMGLYEVSEHKIKEAIRILPDEPVLVYALAQLYHTSGKYKEAIVLYEQLVEEETQDLWQENLFILLADCHNAIGNFEEGIDYLEQIYQEDHTSDSLFQLGFAYLQLKQFPRAVQIFEQLLEMDPDYNSAYFYLAESLDEEHRHEEALDAIQKGIDIDPYQPEFFLFQAKLYLKLSEENEAEKSLDQVLRLDPDLMEAKLLKIDLLIGQESYDEVIQMIETEDNEGIYHPNYEWRLAKVYNEIEEFEKAAAHFDKAYLTLADNLSFLEDYSEFLREEANDTKLAELVAKALMLDPNHTYFNELRENLLTSE